MPHQWPRLHYYPWAVSRHQMCYLVTQVEQSVFGPRKKNIIWSKLGKFEYPSLVWNWNSDSDCTSQGQLKCSLNTLTIGFASLSSTLVAEDCWCLVSRWQTAASGRPPSQHFTRAASRSRCRKCRNTPLHYYANPVEHFCTFI